MSIGGDIIHILGSRAGIAVLWGIVILCAAVLIGAGTWFVVGLGEAIGREIETAFGVRGDGRAMWRGRADTQWYCAIPWSPRLFSKRRVEPF